jgi:L-iditol 2-dehydrogenase
MRVAMLVAPKTIELRDEAAPAAPPPGGIVVRVRAALTDGTDLKTYRRGHPKMPMPTRFGHEFSGDVVAVASGVSAFAVGDAVMCVHTAPCGTCYWCRNEQEELCESLLETMILGAYSDTIEVPGRVVERNCFLKPEAVSYAQAAFLEPLACVVHSIELLAPAPGSVVAIIGNGGFGILHALLLQRRGVQALLFGRRPARVALARELGLESIDTNATPLEKIIAERTDGRGADAAIECTGTAEMWERAPSLVRRGGRASFFAGLPAQTRVAFDAARIHYDEVHLLAPFHFTPADVRAASELIAAGALPLMRLISDRYPLDQIGDAFERLDAGDAIKLLIEP